MHLCYFKTSIGAFLAFTYIQRNIKFCFFEGQQNWFELSMMMKVFWLRLSSCCTSLELCWLLLKFDLWPLVPQVMKTYHMYHTESISAESKLKEAEKQEEKQIGRVVDPVFHIRLEERHQRRSSVKKIEKMKEKVHKKWSLVVHNQDHD